MSLLSITDSRLFCVVIERAKRAMLLERQFKKMVAIRIYAFSIRICVLSCILYLIGYWLACLVCKVE
mgnify:CR=1 FL=1